jgi:hypothetical protein
MPSNPPKFAASLVANVVAEAPPLVVAQLAEVVSQMPLTGLAAEPAGPPQNLLAARAESAIPKTSSTIATRLISAGISKCGRELWPFVAGGWGMIDCFIAGTFSWIGWLIVTAVDDGTGSPDRMTSLPDWAVMSVSCALADDETIAQLHQNRRLHVRVTGSKNS